MEVYEVYGSIRDIRNDALLYFNKVVGYITALSEELAVAKAREQEKIFRSSLDKNQTLQVEYVKAMNSEQIKQKLIEDVL